MGTLSPIQWLALLAVIVLFFGFPEATRELGELMRELGQASRNFRDGMGGSAGTGGPSGPQHPIPVTGPVEAKKANKNSSKQEKPEPEQKVA